MIPLQEHGRLTLQKITESERGIFISDEIQSLTVATAQNSKQFSLIKKEQGEIYLQIAISKIMKEAARFLPCKMNEDDFVYYSKYFSKELWYWKFDDFILCLKNGIEKKYGDIYGEFNVSVFMKWAGLYEVEKENHFHNKHLDTKETPTTREDTKQQIFQERQKQSVDERKEAINLRKYIDETLIKK